MIKSLPPLTGSSPGLSYLKTALYKFCLIGRISQFDAEFQQIETQFPDGHSIAKALFDFRLSQIKKSCNTGSELAPLR